MRELMSYASRLLFIGALILACFAVLEKLANLAGYTLLQGSYDPSRLLEFAGIALLFVFALLLREIRDALLSRSRP
jgi:hypothetical protein